MAFIFSIGVNCVAAAPGDAIYVNGRQAEMIQLMVTHGKQPNYQLKMVLKLLIQTAMYILQMVNTPELIIRV